MLKRSLIAVAAVAVLASIAPAGEIKIHNWPCAFIPQEIAEIPVVMDIGYWVRIKDQDKLKIKLNQISVHEYEGCTDMKVECNFDITLSCSISPTGAVGGKYSCSLNGADVNAPGGTVQVCAKLKDANLGDQPGGSKNVKVATVKISVVPR
jgi:hypothetical protein